MSSSKVETLYLACLLLVDLAHVNRGILNKISNLEVLSDRKISDHYPVIFSIDADLCKKRAKIHVKSHKFSDDNAILFSRSVTENICFENCRCTDEMVEKFNEVLVQSCKNICPVIERKVFKRPDQPWYDETLRNLKQEKRRAERAWRKNKTVGEQNRYLTLKNEYFRLINDTRALYFNKRISHSKGNPKDLFNIVNSLSGEKNEKILPESINPQELPDKFAQYFENKIQMIRESLNKELGNLTTTENVEENSNSLHRNQPSLDVFMSITTEKLKSQFKDMNKKYCEGDPVPIKMISACFDDLCPSILQLVNSVIETGVFPQTLKHAIVSPVIKDANGDKENLKNYRPISNTPILAKIIEKTILIQLNAYLTANNLINELQSAYKKDHSCETAVLKIVNDIQEEISKSNMVILLMLDLSAAFDTIDQDVLLAMLEKVFKIRGRALELLTSYLKGRTYAVHINGRASKVNNLFYGVPQGSILGPLLFSMYISEIEKIAVSNGLTPQLYADDTSLYIGFQPLKDFSSSLQKIRECFFRVKDFMTKNFLKLNVAKTQVIFCGSPTSLALHQSRFNEICSLLEIEEENIKTSGKSLGAVIDCELNFKNMIFETCRGGYFKLNKLRNMRNSLPEDIRLTLIKCYIISKIDYCNFMYANVPKNQIYKLQKCLNAAVRFVYNVRRSTSITPFLKKAHILPVEYRIKYKLSYYMYKITHGTAPPYLCKMFQQHVSNRNLRSTMDTTLMETTHAPGTIAYKMCSTWRELPRFIRESQSIEKFKTSLKTHLFVGAF